MADNLENQGLGSTQGGAPSPAAGDNWYNPDNSQPNVPAGSAPQPAGTTPIMPVDNAPAPATPPLPAGGTPESAGMPVSPTPPTGDAHMKSSNAFLDSLLGGKQSQSGDLSAPTSVPTGAPATPSEPMPPAPMEPAGATGAPIPDSGVSNIAPAPAMPQESTVPEVPQTPPVPPILKTPEAMPGVSQMPPEPKKSKVWIWVILFILVGAGVAYYFISKSSVTTPQSTTTGTISATNTQGNNQDTTRETDLVNMQKALEQYYLANNQKYPVSTAICRTQDTDCVLKNLVSKYIAKLPVDPVASNYYGYKSADGSTYELSAIFENAPQGIKSVETGKGFLVILSPSTTLQSSGSKTGTSSTGTSTDETNL